MLRHSTAIILSKFLGNNSSSPFVLLIGPHKIDAESGQGQTTEMITQRQSKKRQTEISIEKIPFAVNHPDTSAQQRIWMASCR